MMAPDARKRELAAIHVAKAQLGLDDGAYRDMLFSVARVRSAALLDHAGRQAVIEHMRKRGFKKLVKPAAGAVPDHGARPAFRPECGALGGKVAALLAARALHWNYARAMARRMFKIEKLEWCSAEELRRLVAALEYDRKRRRGAGERG